MDCPIFKAMRSGFCLDTDCHYFYPNKGKDEYCKYSEMTQKRKMNNEAARKLKEMLCIRENEKSVNRDGTQGGRR